MKNIYHLGDDFFIAVAFISFIVGSVLKLLGISEIIWGIQTRSIISLSILCLLFSIALSLYDLAHEQK